MSACAVSWSATDCQKFGVRCVGPCAYDQNAWPYTGFVLPTDNMHVSPLYKAVFHIDKPTLSFIGLPWKSVRFPQFEVQVRPALLSSAQLRPHFRKILRHTANVSGMQIMPSRKL